MRNLCTTGLPAPAACSASPPYSSSSLVKPAKHATALRGARLVTWTRFVGGDRLHSLPRPQALHNSSTSSNSSRPCLFRTSSSRYLKRRSSSSSRTTARRLVSASASVGSGTPPSERNNSPAPSEKKSMIEPTGDVDIAPGNNTRGQGPRDWLARLRERFVVDSMSKFVRGILMFLRAGVTAFLVLFTVGLIGNMAVALKPSSEYPNAIKVAYSDFLQSVDKGEVSKVKFIEGSKKVVYQIQNGGQEEAEVKMARVVDDPTLVNRLHSNGVHFASVSTPVGEQIKKFLFTTLALWLPLIPLFFLLRRSMGDRNNNGMNKQLSSGERVGVTFKDVAGVDAVKEELMEVVDGLRDPARFAKLGARLPSGVLLSGPPGTGKTLLARAVAGEANVPFFAISASEFVELFVGKGAQRVRQLFKEARKVAPAVIFIDEIDAVGARRGVMSNDERDQTLNQLLAEMDGFHVKGQEAAEKPVIVLAATNRPTILDPALMRPGRFSRKVFVDVPDEKGRAEILKIHMSKIQIKDAEEREYMLQTLAAATKGCSGAELANIVNEAALLAARRSPKPATPPPASQEEAAATEAAPATVTAAATIKGQVDAATSPAGGEDGASVTMEDFLEAFRREKGGIGRKGGLLENVFLKAIRGQLQKGGEKIEVDADGRPIRAITL